MNLNKTILGIILALSPLSVRADIWSDAKAKATQAKAWTQAKVEQSKKWLQENKLEAAVTASLVVPTAVFLTTSRPWLRNTAAGIFCFNAGALIGGIAGIIYGFEKGEELGLVKGRLFEVSKNFANKILSLPKETLTPELEKSANNLLKTVNSAETR